MHRLMILSVTAGALLLAGCAGDAPDRVDEDVEATQAMTRQPDPDADSLQLMIDAAETIVHMQAEQELAALMNNTRGILIIPRYGSGPGSGSDTAGKGVLLASTGNGWSDPVFYDLGGINIGGELSAEGSPIAFLLLTEVAVDSFKGKNVFSLNAAAGHSMADWSDRAQVSLGMGEDVVIWSDTKGLFTDVAISISEVTLDHEDNRTYYGTADAADVLSGSVVTDRPNPLVDAISGSRATEWTGQQRSTAASTGAGN